MRRSYSSEVQVPPIRAQITRPVIELSYIESLSMSFLYMCLTCVRSLHLHLRPHPLTSPSQNSLHSWTLCSFYWNYQLFMWLLRHPRRDGLPYVDLPWQNCINNMDSQVTVTGYRQSDWPTRSFLKHIVCLRSLRWVWDLTQQKVCYQNNIHTFLYIDNTIIFFSWMNVPS